MSDILSRWNLLPHEEAACEVLSICGSTAWASQLTAQRPYATALELAQAADDIWWSLACDDWLQAFRCHPRIGEHKSEHASQKSTEWSHQEQASGKYVTDTVANTLTLKNQQYDQRFGFTYIVCATGKSSEEMLEILERRLDSSREIELLEAAEQQRQITQIRLRKWLNP